MSELSVDLDFLMFFFDSCNLKKSCMCKYIIAMEETVCVIITNNVTMFVIVIEPDGSIKGKHKIIGIVPCQNLKHNVTNRKL